METVSIIIEKTLSQFLKKEKLAGSSAAGLKDQIEAFLKDLAQHPDTLTPALMKQLLGLLSDLSTSKNVDWMLFVVDFTEKLISYGAILLSAPSNDQDGTEAYLYKKEISSGLVNLVCDCFCAVLARTEKDADALFSFYYTYTPNYFSYDFAARSSSLQQQFLSKVLKALLTAIINPQCEVHSNTLVRCVRTCIDIHIYNEGNAISTAAKAALSQIVNEVFLKMKLTHTRKQISPRNEDPPQRLTKSMTSNTSLASDDLLEFESGHAYDAFLLFNSICSISITSLYTIKTINAIQGLNSNQFRKIDSQTALNVSSKALALELLYLILQNFGSVMERMPIFLNAVNAKLCNSILQNAISEQLDHYLAKAADFLSVEQKTFYVKSSEQIFGSCLAIFLTLFKKFKHHLKLQIEYFIREILIKIKINPYEMPEHDMKRNWMKLQILEELASDPQILVDLFVNYDCDVNCDNLFYEIANSLSSLAQGLSQICINADPGHPEHKKDLSSNGPSSRRSSLSAKPSDTPLSSSTSSSKSYPNPNPNTTNSSLTRDNTPVTTDSDANTSISSSSMKNADLKKAKSTTSDAQSGNTSFYTPPTSSVIILTDACTDAIGKTGTASLFFSAPKKTIQRKYVDGFRLKSIESLYRLLNSLLVFYNTNGKLARNIAARKASVLQEEKPSSQMESLNSAALNEEFEKNPLESLPKPASLSVAQISRDLDVGVTRQDPFQPAYCYNETETTNDVKGSTSVHQHESSIVSNKRFKNLLERGIALFNKKAKSGIAFMQANGVILDTAQSVSEFLHQFKSRRLSKIQIGEYLGEADAFNLDVMHTYVDILSFKDMFFVDAIRYFLAGFRLPGEAQKIDRLMEKFAGKYFKDNHHNLPENFLPRDSSAVPPGELSGTESHLVFEFKNADAAYVLAYSVIMLATDLHSAHVKSKMTKDAFIKNNRGINGNEDLSNDLLSRVYDDIKAQGLSLKEDSPDSSLPRGEETLLNLSSLFHTKGHHSSHFISASLTSHIESMFSIIWSFVLSSLTLSIRASTYLEETCLCLKGFSLGIQLAGIFNFQSELESFVKNLVGLTNLLDVFHNLSAQSLMLAFGPKSIESINTLVYVAVKHGKYFKTTNTWTVILKSISNLEFLCELLNGNDPEFSNPYLKGRFIDIHRDLKSSSLLGTNGHSSRWLSKNPNQQTKDIQVSFLNRMVKAPGITDESKLDLNVLSVQNLSNLASSKKRPSFFDLLHPSRRSSTQILPNDPPCSNTNSQSASSSSQNTSSLSFETIATPSADTSTAIKPKEVNLNSSVVSNEPFSQTMPKAADDKENLKLPQNRQGKLDDHCIDALDHKTASAEKPVKNVAEAVIINLSSTESDPSAPSKNIDPQNAVKEKKNLNRSENINIGGAIEEEDEYENEDEDDHEDEESDFDDTDEEQGTDTGDLEKYEEDEDVEELYKDALREPLSTPSGILKKTSLADPASVLQGQYPPTASRLSSKKHAHPKLSMWERLPVKIDHIFSNSTSFDSEAIVYFVESLVLVSEYELQLMDHPSKQVGDDNGSMLGNPTNRRSSVGSSKIKSLFLRKYMLAKIVEISYYNMQRIRLEWSRLYQIIGQHISQVGVIDNYQDHTTDIALFAIDSLRQLAMKFLEKGEFAHYNFQKDFLYPFLFVAKNSQNNKVKDFVLHCIFQMVDSRPTMLKSGWTNVFSIFSTLIPLEFNESSESNFMKIKDILIEHFRLYYDLAYINALDILEQRALLMPTSSQTVATNRPAKLVMDHVKLAHSALDTILCFLDLVDRLNLSFEAAMTPTSEMAGINTLNPAYDRDAADELSIESVKWQRFYRPALESLVRIILSADSKIRGKALISLVSVLQTHPNFLGKLSPLIYLQ